MSQLSNALTSQTPLPIDYSKLFTPESITHLWHTPIYGDLHSVEQRRYNQLFTLQMNEFALVFEAVVNSYYPKIIESEPLSNDIKRGAVRLIAEEQAHTFEFIELNRRAAPELYSDSRFYFARLRSPLRFAGSLLKHQHFFSPSIVILAALLEERAISYANHYRAEQRNIDPSFFQNFVHHAHEEVFHVEFNLRLFEELWTHSSKLKRQANLAAFSVLLDTFLSTPKRAGIRVINRLVFEHQRLQPMQQRLKQSLFDLAHSQKFLSFLYSKETNPRVYETLKHREEFQAITEKLFGRTWEEA